LTALLIFTDLEPVQRLTGTRFEPLFCTGQLLDNVWLKDRAIFHGAIFNANPRAPGHVRSCLELMLFGCTRAICELRGIYNV